MKLDTSASGVYSIAPTPFLENGAIDWNSVDRMTDFYLACGVSGMTILGVMGEAPKLDGEEAKIKAQEQADAKANGGHITKGEQRQLNREENAESRQIYEEKH